MLLEDTVNYYSSERQPALSDSLSPGLFPTACSLLGRMEYAILPRFDSQCALDYYEILEPGAETPIGLATEIKPGIARRMIRCFFGRNLLPTSVQVYAIGAPAPAFTLHDLLRVWRPRVEVNDATGRALCSFTGLFATIAGGFNVRDATGQQVGRVESADNAGCYFFEGLGGRRIGTIQESVDFGPGQGYRATVTGPPDDRPLASMLILAAALSLVIVYRDRAGGDQAS